jgi:heterodisulfide reductase subunit C
VTDEGDLGARVRVILDRTGVAGCIQCGRCTASCPAALPASLRAREVIRAISDGDLSVVTDRDDIWHCTTCFSCQERCPKGVAITQAILWLRAEAVRMGLYPASHTEALEEIARSGNTFPLDAEVRAVRGRLSLPLDPPDCAHDQEELATFHRLLEVLGFASMAPERRPYPGWDGEGGDEGDDDGNDEGACEEVSDP